MSILPVPSLPTVEEEEEEEEKLITSQHLKEQSTSTQANIAGLPMEYTGTRHADAGRYCMPLCIPVASKRFFEKSYYLSPATWIQSKRTNFRGMQ